MKFFFIKIFYLFNLDIFVIRINSFLQDCKIYRFKKNGININFVNQGFGELDIVGDISKFKIHQSSHLKSDTFIESTGGVTIGKYFHTGRGLTIFSTNHNYDSGNSIPYDAFDIHKPVIIKDFVWCGANVTIMPGVTIGEGVVIGGGAVITKDIPDFAIIGGNPATVIKYRNISLFNELKNQSKFY